MTKLFSEKVAYLGSQDQNRAWRFVKGWQHFFISKDRVASQGSH